MEAVAFHGGFLARSASTSERPDDEVEEETSVAVSPGSGDPSRCQPGTSVQDPARGHLTAGHAMCP